MTYRQDQIDEAYESRKKFLYPNHTFAGFINRLPDVQKVAVLTDNIIRIASSKGFAAYRKGNSYTHVNYLVDRLGLSDYTSILHFRRMLQMLDKTTNNKKDSNKNIVIFNYVDSKLNEIKAELEKELDLVFSMHEHSPSGQPMLNKDGYPKVEPTPQGTTRFRSEVD